MKSFQLSSSIESAPFVNEARGEVLRAAGIRTIEDLLWHLPFRYDDWRKTKKIREVADGETVTLTASVVRTHLKITTRKRFKIFELTVKDATGTLVARFFNQPYLQDQFQQGQQIALHGTARREPFGPYVVMENPQWEIIKTENALPQQVRPVYERIGTLTPKMLRLIIRKCLDALSPQSFGEPLSEEIRKRYKLIERKKAFELLHFPPADISVEELENRRSQGHRRLIFEEFFLLEVGLAYRNRERPLKKRKLRIDDEIRARVKAVLPFTLTAAQKKAIREIVNDMQQSTVMYRLLQGDVGSGKTIIALMAALVAIENGYQTALMVPTEILAEQHFSNLSRMLSNTKYVVRILVSGQGKKLREQIVAEVASGACHLAVGTHALIQQTVEFHRLGLAIVDEQHRFGVLQRDALVRKGEHPDCLIMTATPIPRSLALTAYGDLETSVLDELPPGRKPIKTQTWMLKKKAELYEKISRQLRQGRQAYVLCPLIEESEKLQLSAAEKLAEELRNAFPDLSIGLIHGSIPVKEREVIMGRFLRNEIQMLVATTVIEVGIDVPNASIMVIEHAERFGLSQLHQLRGRVGRGSEQSYCFLLTPAPSDLGEEAKARIKAMVSTNDGFKIAETDLEIRGPGQLTGTRQSGMPTFKIGNLLADTKILEVARKEAFSYVDAFRSQPQALQRFFEQYWNHRFGLIQVG